MEKLKTLTYETTGRIARITLNRDPSFELAPNKTK